MYNHRHTRVCARVYVCMCVCIYVCMRLKNIASVSRAQHVISDSWRSYCVWYSSKLLRGHAWRLFTSAANINTTVAATTATTTYALERIHLSAKEHPEVLTGGCDWCYCALVSNRERNRESLSNKDNTNECVDLNQKRIKQRKDDAKINLHHNGSR